MRNNKEFLYKFNYQCDKNTRGELQKGFERQITFTKQQVSILTF